MLCCIPLIPVTGQEAVAPGTRGAARPAKPAPDFSRAFALLRALGVPSVKDALPRMTDERHYGGNEEMGMLYRAIWEKKGPGGGRVLVIGQTLEVPAANKGEKAENEEAMQMAMMMASIGRAKATQHAAEVLAALARPMEVNRLRNGTPDLEVAKAITSVIGKLKPDNFEDWQVGDTLNALGRSLLFATQLDERGHAETANRLAEAALTTPAGAEPVISTAITLLAESAYAQAFHRFLQKPDMQAWKTDLDGILAKFSRGYANAIAVRLARADAIAALAPKALAIPAAEALANEWRTKILDEVNIKRVKDALSILAGGESSRRLYAMQGFDGDDTPPPVVPWILDAGLAKATDPLGKLLAMGPEAMPILLALATDSSATPNGSTIFHSPADTFASYTSGRLSTEELALAHYQGSMPRPVTVAEIASVFIISALTGLGEDQSRPRPEELAPLVEAWLGSLPARTPIALADHYFEAGNAAQKSAALRIFLTNPSPARLQKIEEFLLAAHPREESFGLMTEYLTARGSTGADFFARYRKALDEEMEIANTEYFRDDWSIFEDSTTKAKKQVLARLKPLDALLKGVDVDALLAELAGSDDYQVIQQQLPLLKSALAKLKPEEAMSRCLAAAVKTNKPEARGKLFQILGQVVPPTPMTDSLREDWKTLLADQRDAYGPRIKAQAVGQQLPNLAELAAYTWQYIHAREQQPDAQRTALLAQVLGQGGYMELLLRRTNAAVDGSLVPPWPDEEKLGKPELEALLAKLNGLPPGELAPAVMALSHKEKFALLGLEKPYEAFGKASRIVREVKLNNTSEKPLAFTKDWQGKALTVAMVMQLIDALRAPGGKESYGVKFTTDPLIPGIQLDSYQVPPNSGSMGGMKKPAVMASLYCAADDSGEAEPISLRTGFLSEEDMTAVGDEEQKKRASESLQKFNESLAKILEPGATNPITLQLDLLRRVPGKPDMRNALDALLPGF